MSTRDRQNEIFGLGVLIWRQIHRVVDRSAKLNKTPNALHQVRTYGYSATSTPAGIFFFDTILALEHPRFVMQYRRKQLQEYVKKYIDTFARALPP
ncbi:hypothetical protein A3A38_01075 [Candidatus Kaiserbacteria bacterium RIFCSPLOWO2_01_FULL_53_17]|uniref:Uncharacterized protein n=1 Tax=Candidatus Kaiserbacteria bacterium RIFCSPLOWO2_01_FULL_53_17 TaxID=1798511 RepID=A0A1F6EHH5_9BACT|nr:MAG: hypothetical protein A3A38_01075 [Candidatus Kaiserbacteria bacterium RIFCSPLOWO2_01_FULL_53_17]